VLDEHLVLEHGDLGEVRALPDDHHALHGLPPRQELRLADDGSASATGLAALTAALLLGLEPGRAVQRGDLVLGVAGLAHPCDGVLRVVLLAVALLAGAAATATATRTGALALLVGLRLVVGTRLVAALLLGALLTGLLLTGAALARPTSAGGRVLLRLTARLFVGLGCRLVTVALCVGVVAGTAAEASASTTTATPAVAA